MQNPHRLIFAKSLALIFPVTHMLKPQFFPHNCFLLFLFLRAVVLSSLLKFTLFSLSPWTLLLHYTLLLRYHLFSQQSCHVSAGKYLGYSSLNHLVLLPPLLATPVCLLHLPLHRKCLHFGHQWYPSLFILWGMDLICTNISTLTSTFFYV